MHAEAISTRFQRRNELSVIGNTKEYVVGETVVGVLLRMIYLMQDFPGGGW